MFFIIIKENLIMDILFFARWLFKKLNQIYFTANKFEFE